MEKKKNILLSELKELIVGKSIVDIYFSYEDVPIYVGKAADIPNKLLCYSCKYIHPLPPIDGVSSLCISIADA